MRTTTMIREKLNARQVRVLELLADGKKTASAMACDLISAVSITTIIEEMVNRGYVERCRSKEDRRRVMLTITEEGRNVLNS